MVSDGPRHAVRLVLARLRGPFRHDSTADEIREELHFHLHMRTDEYARQGLDAESARQAALRRFGNVAVIQDRGYDVRGGGLMETMLQDVKYAIRQLRRQPAFTLLAGLTLALASESRRRSSASSTQRCCGRCPIRIQRS